MSFPLIGITTYRRFDANGNPLISLQETYVQAVSQAGGLPVLIPLGVPDAQIEEMLPRLDGILFSGGGDIDPGYFGRDRHPKVDGVDPERDHLEIRLVRDSVRRGLPFLGICRGIQTVNVALGGTLYTHIPDQLPNAVHHPHIEGYPRDHLAHEIEVRAGTGLGDILGDSLLMVNSMHHQGIENLAPGLQPTAHAPDGLVEAVELTRYSYGIAVQWHPECLTAHASQRSLFRSFVAAAGRRGK